jgi:hypothetical protein
MRQVCHKQRTNSGQTNQRATPHTAHDLYAQVAQQISLGENSKRAVQDNRPVITHNARVVGADHKQRPTPDAANCT